MHRLKAIRRLLWLAAFERRNRCQTCGRQKEHFCGMGACVDVCPKRAYPVASHAYPRCTYAIYPVVSHNGPCHINGVGGWSAE